jgi:hypothetical protein
LRNNLFAHHERYLRSDRRPDDDVVERRRGQTQRIGDRATDGVNSRSAVGV